MQISILFALISLASASPAKKCIAYPPPPTSSSSSTIPTGTTASVSPSSSPTAPVNTGGGSLPAVTAAQDTGKRCTITEQFDSLAFPDFSVSYGADHLKLNNGIAQFTLDTKGAPLLVSKQEFSVGFTETRLKIAAGSGVVTAFITQSNDGAKADEIDYEFVGKDVNHAQTNIFSSGVLDYTNMLMFPSSPAKDLSADFHTYRIDWNTKRIVWSIDGNVVRTLQNTGNGKFPVKPMSVKLSIWDGTNTSGWAGTVDFTKSPFVTQVDFVTVNYAC